ncbi:unnamed protein product [Brachionus calyciflorus]|uniref:Lipase domain-containing protein n=1 Tax=Brachionus calyciflorus TaxID=104777 RepID=A0A813ZNS9_9BILA|nr:unnamed protein product [Brachionus calyciflorus]
MKSTLILFNLLFTFITANKICFNSLGCFIDSFPFKVFPQRPLAWLPDYPRKISTQFLLFTRENPKEPISVNVTTIPENFNGTRPLKCVVHGFLDNALSDWLLEIKDNFLKLEDTNVILINWNKGNFFPYGQAATNTRVVGAEIAVLVNHLIENYGLNSTRVHIIGHSLGSHIAGYAGERIKNLGRITGLDPAGPYFEFTEEIVRLDRTDALFVDTIHSDAASTVLNGYGMYQGIGHVDFYPNGGYNQPGCNIINDRVSCSHSAAVKFFIESMSDQRCKFYGFKCNSKKEFDEGKCLSCGSNGCNTMGYNVSQDKDLGNLYLRTQPMSKTQFCQQHYLISLYSVSSEDNSNLTKAYGVFSVQLESEDQQTDVKVLETIKTVQLQSTHKQLVSFDVAINQDVKSLVIYFSKFNGFLERFLYDSKWSFKYVEVFDPINQKTMKFCTENIKIIESDSYERFFLC